MFNIWTVNNSEMSNWPPTVFYIQDIDMQNMTFRRLLLIFSDHMFTKLALFRNENK